MTKYLTSTALAALVGAAALLASSPTHAQTIVNACGAITTAGLHVLGNSLVSAGGTCIDIQASGVTLAMNGHTIEAAGFSPGQVGVNIEDVSNVTLFGPGRVTGFSDADCEAGLGSSARGVEIGVFGGAVTSGVRVVGLIVDLNCDGVAINGSGTSGVLVGNSIVVRNTREGIRLDNGTNNNAIIRNEVLNNGSHGITAGDAGTDNNTIQDNNASFNAIDNIAIFANTNNNSVESNIAFGAGANDIEDDGTGTVVLDNACEIGDPVSACPDPIPSFSLNH